jgi:phage-related protein
MRYKEFSNKKNKKTTEVAPALAAAAGTVARAIPAAVGGIGRAVGGIANNVAGAAGTVARAIPAAVGGIGRAVGGIANNVAGAAGNTVRNIDRTAGNAISQTNEPNPLSTSSGVAVPSGSIQAQTGTTTTTPLQTPAQNTQQNQLKPGMNILQPSLSKNQPIKVKSVSGSSKEVELDTQKILGHNIKVNQQDLLAVLNQLGTK